MDLPTLRARVEPVLKQDFDAVHEAFLLETGNADARAFLAHLREWELIPATVADALDRAPESLDEPTEPEVGIAFDDELRDAVISATPAPAPPRAGRLPFVDDDDDEAPSEEATIRMDARDLEAAEAEFAALDDASEESAAFEEDPGTGEEADTVFLRGGETSEEPAPPASAPATPIGADPRPTPEGVRRARFRKVTGGLRQTGGFEEAQLARRPLPAELPTDPTGRYLFVGTVGEGAMGRVHLAKDRTLHRRVAYKEMNEALLEQPVLASRFASEVRITAQLDHPGIVPVYALEGDRAYTMKLVEGRTLAGLLAEARLAREGRRPVPKEASRERLLELFARVCDAVAYAHARGVVHRDLKPENVMVGAFGEAYVMDWGIAKVVDRKVERPIETGPTEDEGDLVIGTPGYMSPEQANGQNDALDDRSDQYGLGLLLFEILTLRPAVTGKNALALVTRQQEGEVDPLVHAFGDRIPRELAAILRRTLCKDPHARYVDATALADDVRRALRGEPVAALPEKLVARLSRRVARHREATLFLLMLLVVGIVLTGGGAVALVAWQSARVAARQQATTTLLTIAARQASTVEGQLVKFQGLLSVVATTATDALEDAPTADPAARTGWLAPDFAAAATAPPDAVEQPAGAKYGPGLVSPHHPVFVLPPGTMREAARLDALRLLGPIERHFPRVLLRSHDEQRATVDSLVRRTVLEARIPARWIWIGLEDGFAASYPGHGGWPEGFDVRATEAYRRGRASPVPRWGPPTAHPTGRGTVLGVTQALLDREGRPVGVAGLELGLDWVVEELLLPPELRGHADAEGFLLDATGQVLVRSGAPDSAPALFDVPAVVEAIRERKSGALEEDGTIVLYHRLPSTGGYHVIRGPEAALLP